MLFATSNRHEPVRDFTAFEGVTTLVKMYVVVLALAAAVISNLPVKAAGKVDSDGRTGHYQATVTITIDAEGELRDTIVRYLNEQLALHKDITVVEEGADWSIVVSALEPAMDEQGPKRYMMATVFSEQLRWVDPAIVDELSRTRGPLPTDRLKHFIDTQKKIGRLQTIRMSEGKRGGLAKACAQIINDFDTICVRPRAKALRAMMPSPASKKSGSVPPKH